LSGTLKVARGQQARSFIFRFGLTRLPSELSSYLVMNKLGVVQLEAFRVFGIP
jgi:hypothetical protein